MKFTKNEDVFMKEIDITSTMAILRIAIVGVMSISFIKTSSFFVNFIDRIG
jgi:hypothetical protein